MKLNQIFNTRKDIEYKTRKICIVQRIGNPYKLFRIISSNDSQESFKEYASKEKTGFY